MQTVIVSSQFRWRGVWSPMRDDWIPGLVELDVTGAREFIRNHKARTGETLSFTAFLASCLARAAVEHPHVNAYRNWRNQLIVFDDVDVGVMIEAETNGVAFPHVIRAANRKSFREIHDEIRRVQTQPATSEQQSGVMARVGVYVPQVVRMLFFRLLLLNPQRLKRIAGTVMLTSVGMFAQGGGWGIGFLPLHTIGLTVGGIASVRCWWMGSCSIVSICPSLSASTMILWMVRLPHASPRVSKNGSKVVTGCRLNRTTPLANAVKAMYRRRDVLSSSSCEMG